jgi:hypothetical protein
MLVKHSLAGIHFKLKAINLVKMHYFTIDNPQLFGFHKKIKKPTGILWNYFEKTTFAICIV